MSGLETWYNNVKSNNFYFEIARGTISGHYCYKKFGANFDVAVTAEETIWNAVTHGGNAKYSYLSAAIQLKISSSDVDDTADGTGARTVEIQGLNSDWKFIKETISLNGQTEVLTVNSYIRIFRMRVLTVGSSGQNEGNIWAGTGTVTLGVPANKYALIEYSATLLMNQTLMSVFTIPAGYTGYLHFLDTYIQGGRNGRVSMLTRDNTNSGPFQLKRIIPLKDGEDRRFYEIPIILPEKTDIEFRGINEDASLTLFFGCTFDIVLAKNNNTVEDIDIH